jgi:hypothetical protein
MQPASITSMLQVLKLKPAYTKASTKLRLLSKRFIANAHNRMAKDRRETRRAQNSTESNFADGAKEDSTAPSASQ